MVRGDNLVFGSCMYMRVLWSPLRSVYDLDTLCMGYIQTFAGHYVDGSLSAIMDYVMSFDGTLCIICLMVMYGVFLVLFGIMFSLLSDWIL